MENISDYERMAMFELSDTERPALSKRFNSILSGFTLLDEHDTSNVLPLVSVLDDINTIRDDVAVKSISRDELLSNAPEQQDGYICVPGAID